MQSLNTKDGNGGTELLSAIDFRKGTKVNRKALLAKAIETGGGVANGLVNEFIDYVAKEQPEAAVRALKKEPTVFKTYLRSKAPEHVLDTLSKWKKKSEGARSEA